MIELSKFFTRHVYRFESIDEKVNVLIDYGMYSEEMGTLTFLSIYLTRYLTFVVNVLDFLVHVLDKKINNFLNDFDSKSQ